MCPCSTLGSLKSGKSTFVHVQVAKCTGHPTSSPLLILSCCHCRRNLAATFRTHIINSREANNITNLKPVRVLGSCSFMYMRHGDVYILGVTKSNANVMMAFQFMSNVKAFFCVCPLVLTLTLALLGSLGLNLM